MIAVKRIRILIRNPDSGEPWAYCGDLSDPHALAKAIGEFAVAEIEGGCAEYGRIPLEIKEQAMTDAEVAALPEM